MLKPFAVRVYILYIFLIPDVCSTTETTLKYEPFAVHLPHRDEYTNPWLPLPIISTLIWTWLKEPEVKLSVTHAFWHLGCPLIISGFKKWNIFCHIGDLHANPLTICKGNEMLYLYVCCSWWPHAAKVVAHLDKYWMVKEVSLIIKTEDVME